VGANVVLLAGNHDMRAMVGMCCAGNKNPLLAHLFVRMGSKAVPLFREINDAYLQHDSAADSVLNEALAEESRLHAELFPDAEWYRAFPSLVRGIIADKKIEQELVRIREKTTDMERLCAKHGLSLVRVAAVVAKFRELFLTPGGEFAWFFERMQLVHRVGSVLFIHAGVDDSLAARVRTDGIEGINAWFRRLMRDDLFELYHGAIGNGFRTKYRDTDWPLTERGVRDLHDCGVYAVVHGHRNILSGQRMIFRQGMLNFECDASIDQNTRALHGLDQAGAAVTIFQPDGCVLAISTDFPTAKIFDAVRRNDTTTDEASDMTSERTQDGKISFDAHMTRDEAVTYFEAIVKGLRSGSVTFRRSDDELVLEVGPQLDIEVKASRKGKKQKVEIELGWRAEKPSDLEID
jgi:amphi-Trp domain-containing protein